MRRSLAIAICLVCSSPADATPNHIHLSWQNDTTSTMTIVWRSTNSTGSVNYGKTRSYGQSSEATSNAYAGTFLHQVEIAGLDADTTYYYQVGVEGDWSDSELTFSTAPISGSAYHYAAYGDSRSNDTARAQIRAAVQARNPAFSVSTGDLINTGTVQSQWDTWLNTMEPLISKSPFLSAVGNHEKNASQYYDQFAFPIHAPSDASYADEAYYSFDFADTHFIALSTEPVGEIGDPQYNWLKADLIAAARDPEIRWVVVYAHSPPYSSGSHGSDTITRKTWVHLFESFGVDISFWGHDHHYERTKPLFQDKVVAEGGLTYIVTGGAGAPLYSVTPSDFTAKAEKKFHFLEINVDGDTMTVDARDPDAIFDSMTLTKSGPKSSWVMDGEIDESSAIVGSTNGESLGNLFAGFDGRYLYLATAGMPATGDQFIYLSTTLPTTDVAAPWNKAGNVWNHNSVLAMESENGWSNWQTSAGEVDSAFVRASNPAGSVMEGIVDLQAKFGSVPSVVYIAAVAYETGDSGKVIGQIPQGNEDNDLANGEWISYTVTQPASDAAMPNDGGVGGDGSSTPDGGVLPEPGDEEGCSCQTDSLAPRSASLVGTLLFFAWMVVARRRRNSCP